MPLFRLIETLRLDVHHETNFVTVSAPGFRITRRRLADALKIAASLPREIPPPPPEIKTETTRLLKDLLRSLSAENELFHKNCGELDHIARALAYPIQPPLPCAKYAQRRVIPIIPAPMRTPGAQADD